jgi:hypothetical protein
MCLEVRRTNKEILNRVRGSELIKIAKRDINVYKVFQIERYGINYVRSGILKTPYRDYEISALGDIMTVDKFSFRETAERAVDKGIHAYTSLKVLKQCWYSCLTGRIIVKCIIPAGTPYILGIGSEIVALQLIVPPVKKIAKSSIIK